MIKNLQKGSSAFQGVVVLGVLLVVILVMPKDTQEFGVVSPGSTSGSNEQFQSSSYRDSGNTGTASVETRPTPTAPQAQYVSLGSGNASYSYQPYEEYITIENRGEAAVDITGWQLRNGKDKRPYYTSGSLQRFSADIALIPQAARLIDPTGNVSLGNVVLERGEKAIVTTALPGTQSPYKLHSFKENICSGYLENMEEYAFTPPLNQNCPRPASERGQENLEPSCRDLISTLSSCREPRFDAKDIKGEPCNNCVNGKRVSSQCYAFIQEHFTYRGCVAYHKNDPDFSGRTWRVFLGRGWEMWAEDYESIELFNNLGQLVDYESY